MVLCEKLSNFGYFIKNDFYCNNQSFRDSSEAPFNWKLLLIGIISAKGIWKKFPILKVGGPAPATPPVIRVVLLHAEAADKELCPDTVYYIFVRANIARTLFTYKWIFV